MSFVGKVDETYGSLVLRYPFVFFFFADSMAFSFWDRHVVSAHTSDNG